MRDESVVHASANVDEYAARVAVAALRTPGVRACTLNTDATNPVSNAIYRQIGYVAVADQAQFALVP